MLRRKLLVTFGSLVALLLAMAVFAIWLLQGALARLDHVSKQAFAVIDLSTGLNTSLSAVQIDLYRLQLGEDRYLDGLIHDFEDIQRQVSALGEHYVVREEGIVEHYEKLRRELPKFERRVSSLATAQDADLARQYNAEALQLAIDLREEVQAIENHARKHAHQEQAELVGRFRMLVLGMGLGGIVFINVLAIVLLRTAGMVLRPVDKLVEASRNLTQERYDYRAQIDQQDEFHELAQAYNELAARMQTNERRRMEMLSQVSLTLNHELNNAIATIDLQLEIIGRKVGHEPGLVERLRQIQESLRRMAGTVESLKRVRRIVLTDYISGTKMLDLPRSIAGDAADAPGQTLPDPSAADTGSSSSA